jgi:hypothetical protein
MFPDYNKQEEHVIYVEAPKPEKRLSAFKPVNQMNNLLLAASQQSSTSAPPTPPSAPIPTDRPKKRMKLTNPVEVSNVMHILEQQDAYKQAIREYYLAQLKVLDQV